MSNIFQDVYVQKPKTSRFDLSHDVKTTCGFGKLVPILCQEVLPGDTWRVNTEVFLRAWNPLISPIMHRCNTYVHHFYVPNRIVWPQWDDFMRGGKDNKTEYQMPVFRVTPEEFNTYIAHRTHLGDYFGIPKIQGTVSSQATFDINAIPFIAYRYIYEQYFMDENFEASWIDELRDLLRHDPVITLQTTLSVTSLTGSQYVINVLDSLTDIRNRCWEHDYFTSALPNTQRGNDVHLPIYGQAPLTINSSNSTRIQTPNGLSIGSSILRTHPQDKGIFAHTNSSFIPDSPIPIPEQGRLLAADESTYVRAQVDVTPHTVVDLSAALGATINDFREAMQLQRYNEIIQRVGNRAKEWYKGIFGVNIPDGRLDIPEYLGGGKAPIMISEVLQQSQTTDTSPQGQMAGKAVSASLFGYNDKKFFYEYGFVISILSVMPKSSYFQGLPKIWQKFDRFDYGLPIFANLGEQEVKKGELYFADDGHNDEVFGYVPRYTEYKYIPNYISGHMRDDLQFWHLGRKFDTRPVLSNQFVHTKDDDLNRIFAVTLQEEEDPFVVQILHHIRVRRPLPYFSNPL